MSDPLEPSTEQMPAEPADGGGPTLVVMDSGGSRAIPLPPRGRLVIGRSVDCDVRVDAPSISRRHAMLHVEPDRRFLIEDLGSSNGTRLRGKLLEPEEKVEVPPNVLIEIGDAVCFV